ncbi:MAG: hypothetical protein L0Z62_15310 [Gemmataceae bacterium]|nr:hypothetical protein [Gemmataceae bacterium]
MRYKRLMHDVAILSASVFLGKHGGLFREEALPQAFQELCRFTESGIATYLDGLERLQARVNGRPPPSPLDEPEDIGTAER